MSAHRRTGHGDLTSALYTGIIVVGFLGCQLTEPDVVERGVDGGVVLDGAASLIDTLDASIEDAGRDRPSTSAETSGPRPSGGSGGGLGPDASIGAGGAGGAVALDGGTSDTPTGTASDSGSDDPDYFCAKSTYVFCEDFEHGAGRWETTGSSWETIATGTSEEANHVYRPSEKTASTAYVVGPLWADVTIEVRVMVSSFGSMSSADRAEVYARYVDATTLWAFTLSGDGKLSLRKGMSVVGNTTTVTDIEDVWHSLKLKVVGTTGHTTLEGYLDGKLMVTWTDLTTSSANPLGTIGLGVYGAATPVFDDVRVSTP
jgi:hypothetical protein